MLKEDVLKAYQAQKAECISAFPTLTDTWEYFVLIEKAIDNYYSNVDEVSDAVRALIRAAYVSLTRGGLKCADDKKYGISYNSEIEDGKLDLEKYWYAWEWLNEGLVDKIAYTESSTSTQSTELTSQKVVDAEQPALDEIIGAINAERTVEAEKINELAESFWQGDSKMDFISLVEDRGKVVETPDKKALVKKLYIDNKLLEQIEDNNLDVYVPSYVKGD